MKLRREQMKLRNCVTASLPCVFALFVPLYSQLRETPFRYERNAVSLPARSRFTQRQIGGR